jgi:hypothetical protein
MEVAIRDTAMGEEVFTIKDATHFGKIQGQALAWSADGSTLAVANQLGDIRFWSAAPRTEEAQAARRATWSDYALKWHRRAARDAERERRWFAAAFHLSRVIEACPTDGVLFAHRGRANAQMERWAVAEHDLGRAIELDRAETFETRYQHALLLRRKGDLPGYRKSVAFLFKRWADTKDAEVARRLLQAYVLDDKRAAKRELVERLTRVMLTANDVVIDLHVRGWRRPRLEKGRTYAQLRQLLKTFGRLKQEKKAWLTWPYLPLVCERLGDEYAAGFWLDQAARQIEGDRWTLIEKIEGRRPIQDGDEVGWDDVLALDLLRREIDALLKKAGR